MLALDILHLSHSFLNFGSVSFFLFSFFSMYVCLFVWQASIFFNTLEYKEILFIDSFFVSIFSIFLSLFFVLKQFYNQSDTAPIDRD